MEQREIKNVKTISEYHQIMGLPSPDHPLISVIDIGKHNLDGDSTVFSFSFYAIAIKRDFSGKMRYGQQEYDFDNGMMTFISPKQVFSFESNKKSCTSGWLILIHPDFIWNSTLATAIDQYEFFDYSTNEALFLSEKEENLIINIIQIIQQEYHTNLDGYSQEIIIAQIELLLKYAQRFYQRQFLTRSKANHEVLTQLESLLGEYFNGPNLTDKGMPTVQFVADALHLSPNYLSRLLQNLTGQSTKQFIQDKLIHLAKEKLTTTNLTISQIAYELGFDYPQSFTKLFRAKTNQSPLEFRKSYN